MHFTFSLFAHVLNLYAGCCVIFVLINEHFYYQLPLTLFNTGRQRNLDDVSSQRGGGKLHCCKFWTGCRY